MMLAREVLLWQESVGATVTICSMLSCAWQMCTRGSNLAFVIRNRTFVQANLYGKR
jgi:hypothetical protein